MRFLALPILPSDPLQESAGGLGFPSEVLGFPHWGSRSKVSFRTLLSAFF